MRPPTCTVPDSPQAEDAPMRCRTVWISDLHLGTPGCQAVALLEFLRQVECDTLYLVGDIIDGWQLRRNWFWPQAHNDVVQKILRRVRKGCRVIFVPGNHEYDMQDFDAAHVRLRRTCDLLGLLWLERGELCVIDGCLHFLAGKFLLVKSHQVNLFLLEPPQGFPLTVVFNLKTVCELLSKTLSFSNKPVPKKQQ